MHQGVEEFLSCIVADVRLSCFSSVQLLNRSSHSLIVTGVIDELESGSCDWVPARTAQVCQ